MTGVDTDLATLRHAVMWRSDTAARDAGLALDRVEAELSRLRELCVAIDTGTFDTQRERAEAVEAELSRLREQRDEHAYYRKVQQTYGEEQFDRAEAAEARLGEAHQECARLQQALEAAGREAGRAQDVRANRTRIIGNIALIVDEALAGQPTAAEGPDTPAIPPRPPIQPPGHQREMADTPADDGLCEHGYVREDAAHPAAGLEHCPACDTAAGSQEDKT